MERLEVEHPELAKNIGGLSFQEARQIIFELIARVFSEMPANARELINTSESELADFIPALARVDELDAQYFDLEEIGDIENSATVFQAARFTAACNGIQTAKSHADLSAAAYEAMHARTN